MQALNGYIDTKMISSLIANFLHNNIIYLVKHDKNNHYCASQVQLYWYHDNQKGYEALL